MRTVLLLAIGTAVFLGALLTGCGSTDDPAAAAPARPPQPLFAPPVESSATALPAMPGAEVAQAESEEEADKPETLADVEARLIASLNKGKAPVLETPVVPETEITESAKAPALSVETKEVKGPRTRTLMPEDVQAMAAAAPATVEERLAERIHEHKTEDSMAGMAPIGEPPVVVAVNKPGDEPGMAMGTGGNEGEAKIETPSTPDELVGRERIVAEARRAEADAKFQAGTNLFHKQLYREALAAFEEALSLAPDHKEALAMRNRCRDLTGDPGPDKDDQLIRQVAERERTKMLAVEMRLKADIAEAEKLFLNATTMDETRKMMAPEEQISESTAFLKRSLERLRQVDAVLGTSPIADGAQKEMRLRVKALQTQILDERQALEEKLAQIERTQAQEAVKQARQEAELNHKKRVAQILDAAKVFIKQDRFDEAIRLCEEVMKEDPNNAEARELRNNARAEAHRLANAENYKAATNMEEQWRLDVEEQEIMQSDFLVYPENWDEIKRRVRRRQSLRDNSSGDRAVLSMLESERMSIEWVDQTLRDVLMEIEERGRINIEVANEVDQDQTVTLQLTDISLRKLLNYVLELTGLNFEVRDEVIFISDQVQQELVLQIYPVYDLTRPLRDFHPEDDEDAEDEEGVEAEALTDIRERITTIIPGFEDDNPGISIDIWEDNLIVMQTPDVHEQLVKYLSTLREFSKQQALVELRFLEVRDNLNEEIGWTWGQKQIYTNPGGGAASYYPTGADLISGVAPLGEGFRAWHQDDGRSVNAISSFTPQTGAADNDTQHQGAVLNIGYLSQQIDGMRQIELDALFHGLEEQSRGSVLHNPRLLVANGKNAYLEVETDVSYIARYTQQGTAWQAEVEHYQQGFTLSVRPVISFDRKYITVRLRPSMEALVESNTRIERRTIVVAQDATGEAVLATVNLPFTLPILRVVEFETYGTVPDGGTLLVGGVIEDERTQEMSGIPLLSSIPILGSLTRSTDRFHEKSNLVMMLHSKVVELD